MPGLKRHLDGDAKARDDHTHPARKRRLDYSESDARLAKIYNDLADEVQSIRLKAAGDLIKHVSVQSDQQRKLLDVALSRLIKGLCSGRKAARLGFSVALAEILPTAVKLHSEALTLGEITQKIIDLTQFEGNASGQERRDALIGRRFAFQAILQSNLALSPAISSKDWNALLYAIVELASQKQWLRRECGAMMYEFLNGKDAQSLTHDRVQALSDAWNEKSLWKTPEGIAIWLALSRRGDGVKLPKHVWHHKNPFAAKERSALTKLMQEIPLEDAAAPHNGKAAQTGARQAAPSFAWHVILRHLSEPDEQKNFARFWSDVGERGLFAASSSSERKALGFQVLSLVIDCVPESMMGDVLLPGIVQSILTQRGSADRYLFEAAKTPLSQIVARVKHQPSAAAALIGPLIMHSGPNFDQLSKTKTVESSFTLADDAASESFIEALDIFMRKPDGRDVTQAGNRRRMLADLLLSLLRCRREQSELFCGGSGDQSLVSWLDRLLDILVNAGYETEQIAGSLYDPPVSEATQTMLQSRLMSCLGHLSSFSIGSTIAATRALIAKLRPSLSHLVLKGPDPTSTIGLAERTLEELDLQLERSDNPSSSAASLQALQLLMSMSILHVHSQDPDAEPALQDLLAAYEAWDDMANSTTILIELLLSFISKPAALYKRLAEQAFTAFTPHLHSDSLESMINILRQKESLIGQQELFDQQDDDAKMEEVDEQEEDTTDDDALDVEELSDLELTDGIEAEKIEVLNELSSGSEVGSQSSIELDDEDGDETGDDDDEEAAFDRKLADALGTAGPDKDDDEHGSDMDDEQMMALEGHLTSIFKERKSQRSTKQESKDARLNIINFKSRVLDLLMVLSKTQPDQAVVLEMIYPLIVLIRTTTSNQIAEKAYLVLKTCFEGCSKRKILPDMDDNDSGVALLELIHDEVALGGSKVHASACSKSSLFVAKIMLAHDEQNYELVSICYHKLQTSWYLDRQSKIPSSIFTDWNSWSIATRKQRQ